MTTLHESADAIPSTPTEGTTRSRQSEQLQNLSTPMQQAMEQVVGSTAQEREQSVYEVEAAAGSQITRPIQIVMADAAAAGAGIEEVGRAAVVAEMNATAARKLTLPAIGKLRRALDK